MTALGRDPFIFFRKCFRAIKKTNDFDEMNHKRALAIIFKDNSKMSCYNTGQPIVYSKLGAIIPFISFLFVI